MMIKSILATFLGLALTSSFAFADKTDDKGMMATFKTEDGKQIRCLVHKDDHAVVQAVVGEKVKLDDTKALAVEQDMAP
ncbi:hypothetical protein [Legionella yabuuchiae]|uniref:hypothetical protein n=1 Tax=Legionella yabuuchiae TaxID=376727 RepID=UPI001055748D|nr:hypothetical protein [Legionella yabuuchiae]